MPRHRLCHSGACVIVNILWLVPGNPIRLSTALIAFILAPTLLLLGVLGWLGLQFVQDQVERRLREDIELIARALQGPVGRGIDEDDFAAVRESLRSAFAFERVYGAHVFDQQGRLIASSGAGPDYREGRRLAVANQSSEPVGEFREVAGQDVFSYFVPLTGSAGRFSGVLQISRHGTEFRDSVLQIRGWGLSALAALGVVLSGLLLFGHRRAIGAPIQQLVDGMRRVEVGERDHRARPSGPSELRTLAAGFNSMMDSLSRSEREIARRQAQEQALHEELRHSQKLAAIGALAAGVAHELGTPLSVVDGRAQRMLRRSENAAVVGDAATAIRAEVRRMERIVRQLMAFARRSELRPRVVSAEQMVRLAVAAVDDAGGDALPIEVTGAGRPSPALRVDQERLLQALVNLLQNAQQASRAGPVRIGWSEQGEQVALTVEDSGAGIDPAIRERLFEPFFTTKPAGAGTGLGLAVVHGVMEDHGGRIVVGASPDLGGALFRLLLPRVQEGGADGR